MALAAVAPVHEGVVVVEVSSAGAETIVHGSTPKGGVVAKIAVVAAVAASGKGRKTRRVVRA